MNKIKRKIAKRKVFVGMSGGVDSSVAALLLKKHGYDVVGVFMRSFNIDGCEETDVEDARRVAGKLGIPFYVWDFEEEYKKKVVEYMIDGYRRGLTPNPDVMCNKEIKFGLFLERALKFGADYVATGHYVRLATRDKRQETRKEKQKTKNQKNLSHVSGLMSLFVARDKNKDQSYFLWTLTQKQLRHCLFPIGDYQKLEVRKIAKRAGLPTAEKKDSQGICFLGKVTLADFLKDYIPVKEGEVLNVAGKVIGKHSGAQFYTIGQRHIGMANRRPTQIERGLTQETNFKPLYVAEKDIKTNTLVVAEGSDNSALYKKEVKINNVNFINPKLLSLIRANKGYNGIKVFARVRYRQPLFKATLVTRNKRRETRGKGKNKKNLSHVSGLMSLIFDKPQRFVAAGQSAVLYSKFGQMLGGGIIL